MIIERIGFLIYQKKYFIAIKIMKL